MERQARRMIQQLFDNHVFLYIMGGLCGLGVFLKCLLLVVYNKLIAASENMNCTKKNWLKNMKLRFESSYQLQLSVNNVDTYVDKYVSKIKYGGLLLSTWENISGQTIGLCLLTGSFAGILGFVYDCGQSQVLFTFFAGAWTAIIVNIVDNIVNISAHRQMLRYNLIDYFENNLKVRMEQEVFHPEARKKYQREYFEDSKEEDIDVGNSVFSKKELKELKKSDFPSLDYSSATRVELDDMEEIIPEILSKSEQRKKDKLSVKEAKSKKEQDKLDAKQARKRSKLDLKQAKKQEKQEIKQAKQQAKIDSKQARIDAKEAKKQAKMDKKQARIDAKKAKKQAVIGAKKEKKQRREEVREAKERAEIEAIQAKKREKDEEKAERERLELERKQKSVKNNKAYNEKMRLKEDKQREAKLREKEIERIKEERKQVRTESTREEKLVVAELNNRARNDDHERRSKDKFINERAKNDRVNKPSLTNDRRDKEDFKNKNSSEDKESLEMTAISKEEDLLIEEVLKDFLL